VGTVTVTIVWTLNLKGLYGRLKNTR
jgi:hypothetical protein